MRGDDDMPVWGDDPAVLRCDHRPAADPEADGRAPGGRAPDGREPGRRAPGGQGPGGDPETGAARPAAEILAWSRRLLDPAMRDAIETLPDAMHGIAAYHFGWRDERGRPLDAAAGASGKAIRPALVLLTAQAVGGTADAAVPAAVAVELAHNFSLLHDDVMDGDLTRRHRPTAWSVFGTGPAVLAGDALLAAAFEALAGEGAAIVPRAVRTLGRAVIELVEGQSADLAFEERGDVTLDECVAMAYRKTGALLGAACALGSDHGGGTAAQTARLRTFGERLGLAFQLADDLLGIWGDPAVTGKPVHADLRTRKKSLPVVAALTSATPAGHELAALYLRDEPLTDDDASRAAALIDAAGGRAWTTARADAVLADALRELDA
ncbi:polyprenyl synthetase family protein, partial [Actinomadura sp. KC06]|uniref:polyprenyl synthetase family protein n=1 Tax=Actinomadura sp. KC06 TaxID=2530369 RepID=UPI001FB6DE67